MEYPKWKYHAIEPACVVDSEEAEKALGKGWFNHPNDAKKPVDVEKPIEKPAKEAK